MLSIVAAAIFCCCRNADIGRESLAMRGYAWRAGSVAIAVVLYALPAGALDMSRAVQLAQNVSDAGRGAAGPSQQPAANAPSASPTSLLRTFQSAATISAGRPGDSLASGVGRA